MDNEKKLAWFNANNQKPYPVFILKISRIADYYCHYFNHWLPKGENGYWDADCRREPDGSWKKYSQCINSALNEAGFTYLTKELANEKIPSIWMTDFDFPDDDPRWDDDDFVHPLIPASVYDCLFGDRW